jgi:hypothetical protein
VAVLPPVTEGIANAAARLVDDREATRLPSHYDLARIIKECGLEQADPNQTGLPRGKTKRIRQVLLYAIEHDEPAGQQLLGKLVDEVRTDGGFREGSANYVGSEAITNLASELRELGFELTSSGHLRPLVLSTLEGAAVTEALKGYARRAQHGAKDAAWSSVPARTCSKQPPAMSLLSEASPMTPPK